ncbi:efflux RND transporter periplasmic adaptor subunit [Deminuibacter soli]|uniref:Efflux RND transporter periplasmic adaptor subunit n=1 Tax=Deminuibacter soli TaxID=2291815 RepID=A0A3E1NCY2_9BACT|nr:efflux RND transporter periplasmic adaptor subunit [Deminuibacter soli]RFM25674.1 efflux RND transporter periplasmic adaptor subunit [Deminuibacter soli]
MKQTIILFTVLLAGVYGCSSGNSAEHKPAPKAPKQQYTLAPLEKGGVSGTLQLPAQLAAYQEVSIFPKVNGYVQQVSVDIGSQVHKGQLLMTLQAPELQQASVQAREKYGRAQADYTISVENYKRLLQAAATKGAIAPMDLATAKARTEADSALRNAEKANWQMQQTMQDYLEVRAPFDGVITERNVHPGALVSATAKEQKPMLELKQTNRLRLQVDVPEYAGSAIAGKEKMDFFLSAFPGKKMSAAITRRSGNINMQYRTMRVEMDVYNADGMLTPGMYADVVLQLTGNKDAWVVSKQAVVTSTERKYVVVVRKGVTVKVDVTTGNTSAEKTEVFGSFEPGDQVMVNASDEIKEGIKV